MYQHIQLFNPNMEQKKAIPLRLRRISRMNQIYLSRMALQCSPQEALNNYQAQQTSQQPLLFIQSSIIKTKAVLFSNNTNKSKVQVGRKYMRKVSELASCIKTTQSKCINLCDSVNEEKQKESKITTTRHDQKKRLIQLNNSARSEDNNPIHNLKTNKTLSLNVSIAMGKKLNLQQNSQSLKRSTIPKNLPQIYKVHSNITNKNLPVNVSLKKNIPLLTRNAQQLKHIKAQSYVILQYPSNSLIVSFQANMPVEIASLTKIMTFHTVMAIAKKNSIDVSREKYQIPDHIIQVQGTSAQLYGGQIYTIQQLLYGLMLPSGNDAATCLALWGAQFLTQQDNPDSKIKFFVIEMNRTAKILGLLNTRFGNPHGLPHIQSKSNALQVAKLCSICLNDDLFTNVTKTQKYTCIVQNQLLKVHREVQWKNTNKLLRRQGFIGIKTGITVTAGPCLATAYFFRDKIYITVILRANKVSRRFKQTRKLLYWCLNKMYKDNLSEQENKCIWSLNKKKPKIDSDYSEDQQEFNYEMSGQAQFKKRRDIIAYDL